MHLTSSPARDSLGCVMPCTVLIRCHRQSPELAGLHGADMSRSSLSGGLPLGPELLSMRGPYLAVDEWTVVPRNYIPGPGG